MEPMTSAPGLKLSELISALSHALDITEGQPEGHCVRCCWIGIHVGRRLGLAEQALWELYYTLLLKDLGCSSNAARICELYLTDDRQFKRDFKSVGDSLPQVLNFVLRHTGLKAGLAERFRSVLTILRDGEEIAQELIATRCQRGADIARRLRFPEAVAAGIYSLDEHFNGQGKPEGLAGEAIPLYARIALLAQVVDVFPHHRRSRHRPGRNRRASGHLVRPGPGRCLRRGGPGRGVLDHPGRRGSDPGGAGPGAFPLRGAPGRGLPGRHRRRLRPGGGLEEPLHQRPQRPGGPLRRSHRRGHGALPGAPTLAEARRPAPRRGQARGQQQRPRQAGQARRRRVGRGEAARHLYRDHPRSDSAPSPNWPG